MWIYPKDLPYQIISDEEMKWEKFLSKNAFKNYRYSRGYLRSSLAKIFNTTPLKVPLKSNPGEAPTLGSNNGYVSISHSIDKVFLAWAPENIGIDIEQKKRIFNYRKIVTRFFKDLEIKELSKIDDLSYGQEVLKYWVIKESAYKWQSKKDNSDFFEWEWIKNLEIALNKKKNLKVRTYFHNYQNSYLGIAYNSN